MSRTVPEEFVECEYFRTWVSRCFKLGLLSAFVVWCCNNTYWYRSIEESVEITWYLGQMNLVFKQYFHMLCQVTAVHTLMINFRSELFQMSFQSYYFPYYWVDPRFCIDLCCCYWWYAVFQWNLGCSRTTSTNSFYESDASCSSVIQDFEFS